MSTPEAPPARRRWLILAVIGIAQLMVILDNSIVNIALPSAQADLGFDDAQRQWIITAYALAFGSLLLLGGRLSDLFGRKRAFLVGLVGFAVASILGGLAPGFELLVAARALQGVFGALLAPAALSLLTTTFTEGRERARAFGVFAALAGSGAAIGLLLGGALTQYVDWRWCMYVNAVFAAVAFLGASLLLPAQPVEHRPHLDVVGTVLASAGLFSVVYGFASAETDGWTSPLVYAFLAAGLVLLVAFVLVQRRVKAPLLPLRVVLDRFRGGSFLTILVLTTGMFGVTLFLAYVMQQVFGFSPLMTGVAFLPMVACIVLAANTVPALLLPRTGPKPLVVVGMLLGAGGLFWFSFLTPESGYAAHVLGPLLMIGLGMGTAMSTSINTATYGVEPGDAGVASALGEHDAAGRRVGRHRAALEHRGHRGRRLRGAAARRGAARLHDRVHGRRGHLRRRRRRRRVPHPRRPDHRAERRHHPDGPHRARGARRHGAGGRGPRRRRPGRGRGDADARRHGRPRGGPGGHRRRRRLHAARDARRPPARRRGRGACPDRAADRAHRRADHPRRRRPRPDPGARPHLRCAPRT